MNPNKMPIPQPVTFVLERLEACGYHAYCVGGCVRDHLMGRTPTDYDVTTNATPDEMLTVFADCRLVETGLQHGTVTVVRAGMNIEVTTYRIDGAYSDGRHPEAVTFTDRLSDDLCRRDFTINAMATSPARGLVDLFGGQEDLANRLIRCVGDAETRFREDGLRILRALRFAAVLDFTLDDACAAAVCALTPLLEKISRERIYVELTKLLCGAGASRILAAFPKTVAFVLPALTAEDVRAAAALLDDPRCPREPAIRYAILFRALNDRDAASAMQSLKPSRNEKAAVLLYRMTPPQAEDVAIRLCMSRTDDDAPAALARYSALTGAIPWSTAESIGVIADTVVRENRPRRLSMLAIRGADLIPCGYQGSAIGAMLDKLLLAVIRGDCKNDKEALLAYAKKETIA